MTTPKSPTRIDAFLTDLAQQTWPDALVTVADEGTASECWLLAYTQISRERKQYVTIGLGNRFAVARKALTLYFKSCKTNDRQIEFDVTIANPLPESGDMTAQHLEDVRKQADEPVVIDVTIEHVARCLVTDEEQTKLVEDSRD